MEHLAMFRVFPPFITAVDELVGVSEATRDAASGLVLWNLAENLLHPDRHDTRSAEEVLHKGDVLCRYRLFVSRSGARGVKTGSNWCISLARLLGEAKRVRAGSSTIARRETALQYWSTPP